MTILLKHLTRFFSRLAVHQHAGCVPCTSSI